MSYIDEQRAKEEARINEQNMKELGTNVKSLKAEIRELNKTVNELKIIIERAFR